MALRDYKGPVTIGIAFSMVIGFVLSISSETALEAAEFIPLFCPLKAILSIDCPTCGLGRSLAFAFRAEWSESLSAHPLGIPFLLLLTIGIHLAWVAPKTLAGITQRFRRLSGAYPKAFAAILGLYCIWGFGRNYY